jgi:hypothetical protein
MGMKKNPDPQAPKMVLSWQFRQNGRMLTCGIAAAGAKTFNVITMPHWNLGHGSVERFTCAMEALQRHAAIAAELRAAGWSPASYTQTH